MSFVIIVDFISQFDRKTLSKYNIIAVSNEVIEQNNYISPIKYISIFKKYLRLGKDIISLSNSSKLNRSFFSSVAAKDILLDEYHNRKIECIDTLNFGVSVEKICILASKLRKEKWTIDETCRKIRDYIYDVRCELFYEINSRSAFFRKFNVAHIDFGGAVDVIYKTSRLRNAIKKIMCIINKCDLKNQKIYIVYNYIDERTYELIANLKMSRNDIVIYRQKLPFFELEKCSSIAIFYDYKTKI